LGKKLGSLKRKSNYPQSEKALGAAAGTRRDLCPALGISITRRTHMQQWIFLSMAIISEVIATSTLKASDGFSRLWPSLIVTAGYASAFYFLSLTLKTIPVGMAYAIWSGAGVALIALIAWVFFGQKLDIPAVIGLLLIVAGIVVLNVFSRTIAH
jgi:small multidrug resistance pump